MDMYNRLLKIVIVLLLAGLVVPCEAADVSKTESFTVLRHYLRGTETHSREINFPCTGSFLPVFAFSKNRQLGLYSYRFLPKSAGTPQIWLVDLQNGNTLNSFAGHLSTQSIAFSPDGKKAISGGDDGKRGVAEGWWRQNWRHLIGDDSNKSAPLGILRLWDITTGKEINSAKGHNTYIRAVAYSPTEELALSGGDDRDIVLWNLKDLTIVRKFTGHTSGIRNLDWSKDGKTFLSGSWDGSIRLWDIHTGKELTHLQSHHGRVMSSALSPDANFALSSHLSGPNQPVIYWDLKQKKEINRFGIPGNPWHANMVLHVQSVAFSPDGKTALFGLEFGSVIWWSLDDWKEIAHNRIFKKELAYVTFSADGNYCISVGCDIDKSATNKKAQAKVRYWKLPNP